MRIVTVLNPQTQQPVEIHTDAETWGELKGILMDKNINPSGMKGIVRETRNSLETDAALLPDSDFTLFLSASKMSAGNGN